MRLTRKNQATASAGAIKAPTARDFLFSLAQVQRSNCTLSWSWERLFLKSSPPSPKLLGDAANEVLLEGATPVLPCVIGGDLDGLVGRARPIVEKPEEAGLSRTSGAEEGNVDWWRGVASGQPRPQLSPGGQTCPDQPPSGQGDLDLDVDTQDVGHPWCGGVLARGPVRVESERPS